MLGVVVSCCSLCGGRIRRFHTKEGGKEERGVRKKKKVVTGFDKNLFLRCVDHMKKFVTVQKKMRRRQWSCSDSDNKSAQATPSVVLLTS